MHIAIRIGLWSLAALFVLALGLYAYLRNADLSMYESQIEGYVSEKIGHKLDVEMPITAEVYRLLYEDKPAKQAVLDLMTRPLKKE